MRRHIPYATKKFQTMGRECDNIWVPTRGALRVSFVIVGGGSLHAHGA